MKPELRRGMVVWAELDPTRGMEQAGRRPALVVASDLYLEQADSLAIIVPCTSRDRGVAEPREAGGQNLDLPDETFAMTEQPRTVTRERLFEVAGMIDVGAMREVDEWLRDFLALP